jgi:hypothetical protein
MNKPAAFRATYSDLKLIKTRQCVQVIFELPLADFDAAYVILGGMPNPASETWFGIAPLKAPQAEKENETPKSPATPQPTAHPPAAAKREKMDWRDMQPSSQAYLLCEKPVFQAFLKEEYPDEWHESMSDAAECVRLICAVVSRSQLNDGPHRVIWHQLNEQYDLWALKERVGA